MENCRLVLAVYCEFFLLSYLNIPLMFVPPPSVQFQHLTRWTMGRWPYAKPLPLANQDTTVMRLMPWPKTSKSWALFTPDKVWFPSAHFVASKLYFWRRPPQPFPFLPFFYTPLSAAYSAVSIVTLPNVTMSYTTPVYHGTQMLKKTYSALHSPHPKHISSAHSILLCGGTLTSSMRCQILNCEVVVF